MHLSDAMTVLLVNNEIKIGTRAVSTEIFLRIVL